MQTDTVEQKTVVTPSEPVPIMVELTEEDKNQAGPHISNTHCIIATALNRMGHTGVWVGSDYGRIGGQGYRFSGGYETDLWDREKNRYVPDIVGRQIILYPDEEVSRLF